jgi:hypothetical protein
MTKAHVQPEPKTVSAIWSALQWFTLDNISKIAAIGTPILIAVGGWYLSNVWKTRDQNISTYEKTSAAIGKLSVQDTDHQRDALFSIIQLSRPDLLRRVAAYIEARIDAQESAEQWKITSANGSGDEARNTALFQSKVKFSSLRNDIFQPLVVGAINANDPEVAESLVDAVPSVLQFSTRVPDASDASSSNLLNLLDYAVKAKSKRLVSYLLSKGQQAHFWTVNLALDSGNAAILEEVARASAKNTSINYYVWAHAAKSATPEQIRILAGNGFGRSAGTPINQPPVLSIAADNFAFANLKPLFDVGFSPFVSTIDQRKELMGEASYSYLSKNISGSPDQSALTKTISILCAQYAKEGVSASKLIAEFELAGEHYPKSVIDSSRQVVLWQLFEGKDSDAIDCALKFYEIDRLPEAGKLEVLIENAIGRDGAAQLLIEKFNFPFDGREEPTQETPGMRAAARADIGFLDYLIKRKVELSGQDRDGKTIWNYFINSNFNDIPQRSNAIFYISSRRFHETAAKIAEAVKIDLPDSKGLTALHIAINSANAEKLKAIVALKPNLDALTKGGQSALSMAASTPGFYMYLYGAGARAPGKIEVCNTAIELAKAINDQGYFDPEQSPIKTAMSSAPAGCFPAK